MRSQIHYDEVKPISRLDAESAFKSGEIAQICDALVRLTYHDSDHKWVENQCVEFVRHPNVEVRGLALTCLEHLARIHRQLDLNRVVPLLKVLSSDPEVGQRAQDALDDIRTFMGDV